MRWARSERQHQGPQQGSANGLVIRESRIESQTRQRPPVAPLPRQRQRKQTHGHQYAQSAGTRQSNPKTNGRKCQHREYIQNPQRCDRRKHLGYIAPVKEIEILGPALPHLRKTLVHARLDPLGARQKKQLAPLRFDSPRQFDIFENRPLHRFMPATPFVTFAAHQQVLPVCGGRRRLRVRDVLKAKKGCQLHVHQGDDRFFPPRRRLLARRKRNQIGVLILRPLQKLSQASRLMLGVGVGEKQPIPRGHALPPAPRRASSPAILPVMTPHAKCAGEESPLPGRSEFPAVRSADWSFTTRISRTPGWLASDLTTRSILTSSLRAGMITETRASWLTSIH